MLVVAGSLRLWWWSTVLVVAGSLRLWWCNTMLVVVNSLWAVVVQWGLRWLLVILMIIWDNTGLVVIR